MRTIHDRPHGKASARTSEIVDTLSSRNTTCRTTTFSFKLHLGLSLNHNGLSFEKDHDSQNIGFFKIILLLSFRSPKWKAERMGLDVFQTLETIHIMNKLSRSALCLHNPPRYAGDLFNYRTPKS